MGLPEDCLRVRRKLQSIVGTMGREKLMLDIERVNAVVIARANNHHHGHNVGEKSYFQAMQLVVVVSRLNRQTSSHDQELS